MSETAGHPRLRVVAEGETPPPGLAASLRLVATLTVAGLLSGAILVGTYRLTLPRIQANQKAALEAAVFQVLPGATAMSRVVWQDGSLVEVASSEPGAEVVFLGRAADGAPVGYAVPAEGSGYQDTIGLIFGFVPERQRVVGLVVLESRETPGLGDKIIKDEAFVGSFRDLAVEPEIVLTKDGAAAENEVDAITGATISSRSVVKIVNSGLATWRPRLGQATPGENAR